MAVTALLLARFSPLVAATNFVLEARRKIVRRTWGFVGLATVALFIIGLSTHYAA
jgi:hypothetical protein